jgi:hypothetical protein
MPLAASILKLYEIHKEYGSMCQGMEDESWPNESISLIPFSLRSIEIDHFSIFLYFAII